MKLTKLTEKPELASLDDSVSLVVTGREKSDTGETDVLRRAKLSTLTSGLKKELKKELTDPIEDVTDSLKGLTDALDRRVTTLEAAVSGGVTETGEVCEAVGERGLAMPRGVLPYAKLERVGGITTAVGTTGEDGVTEWTDAPSDIKSVEIRGANLGFRLKESVKEFEQDGCNFAPTGDGGLKIWCDDYYQDIDKKINSVDASKFEQDPLEPFKVKLSGTKYLPADSADDLRCLSPIVYNEDGEVTSEISVTSFGYRIYGDLGFVGDVTPSGFVASTVYTKVDPNENPNWRVRDMYIYFGGKNLTVNAYNYSVVVPLGVFRSESALSAEDFKPYREPKVLELPTLPEGKDWHGFDRDFSNFMSFDEDGAASYTDNYLKTEIEESDFVGYSGYDYSSGYGCFKETIARVDTARSWLRDIGSGKIIWVDFRPDWSAATYNNGAYYAYLTEAELAEVKAELAEYIAANRGLFASRTLPPSEVSETELGLSIDPYIEVEAGGSVRLLGSDGEPVRGVIGLTYQTKKEL